MKAKKILIVYLKGFMSNIASKEHMFNKVVKELEKEGRKVKKIVQTDSDKTVYFTDGTRVHLAPFGRPLHAYKCTELYVDESIINLPNGHEFMNNIIATSVVPEGDYTNLEVNGKPLDRAKTYSSSVDHGFILKHYKGE